MEHDFNLDNTSDDVVFEDNNFYDFWDDTYEVSEDINYLLIFCYGLKLIKK